MMNVVVYGYPENPEAEADTFVQINHVHRASVDTIPADDGVIAGHVFQGHERGNINLFIRREGNRFTGILQERMGWRALMRGGELCVFKARALNEILMLVGHYGAHSVMLDYPATYDDSWLDFPLLDANPMESLADLDNAKHAIRSRIAQIATLLEGVKLYTQALVIGLVDNPLREIIVALDEKAYAVWKSNQIKFRDHLEFNPPVGVAFSRTPEY